MSLATATLRSAVWNHGGKIVEYFLMYAASLVVARGLGVVDNGVYASIVSLSQLLLVLSSFGLETVINKSFPQIPAEIALVGRTFLLRRIVALRAGLFALAAVSLWALSGFIPGLPGPARDWLALLITYAFARSLIPLFAIALTVEMRTDITAKINVVARVIELLVFVWGSRSGFSLSFVLGTLVVSGFLQLAAYAMVTGRTLARSATELPLRPLLTFGGIFWINALVDYVLGRQGDVFLLSRLLPDPAYASLYDVAYSTLQLAHLGATAGLAGVTFATFAGLAVRSPEAMAPFYHILIRVVTLLTVPLFAFLLFNGEIFMLALYGKAFAGAAGLIQGMAIFRILSRLFGGGENAEYLLSVGGVKQLVGAGAFAACCNAGLNLILIPRLAAGGSVIASGTANLLANAIGFMLLRGRVQLQPAFWTKVTLVGIVLSFASSLIEVGPPLLTLGVRLVVFCALIATAVYVLQIVSREDTRRISDAVSSLFSPRSSAQREDS